MKGVYEGKWCYLLQRRYVSINYTNGLSHHCFIIQYFFSMYQLNDTRFWNTLLSQNNYIHKYIILHWRDRTEWYSKYETLWERFMENNLILYCYFDRINIRKKYWNRENSPIKMQFMPQFPKNINYSHLRPSWILACHYA